MKFIFNVLLTEAFWNPLSKATTNIENRRFRLKIIPLYDKIVVTTKIKKGLKNEANTLVHYFTIEYQMY